MLRSLRVATAFLFTVPCPVLAQGASGVVLGFDGKPAVGAAVAAMWKGPVGRGAEVLTDAAGRFSFDGDPPIEVLHVRVEGVAKDVPIPKGGGKDLTISFADAPRVTTRGAVTMPDGSPAASIDVGLVGADGKTMATVTTDARGAFEGHTGEAVAELRVDPFGWRHVVRGPFGDSVTVDLQRGKKGRWFCLRGRVLDDRGPCADSIVRGHLVDGGIVRVRTRADGGYTLWADRDVTMLDVPRCLPIVRKGSFAGDTTSLDLDETEHGLVPVAGRVLDARGEGIPSARIFAVDRGGPPENGLLPDGWTDFEGHFRLLLPRNTPFVHATTEDGRSGTAAVPAHRMDIRIRAD